MRLFVVLLISCYSVSVFSQQSALSVVEKAEGGDEDEVVTADEDEDVVQPTAEWQTLRPGQAVPAGSHVRLNLQTGQREVRLGDEQLKYWSQKHRETSGIQSSFTPEELKRAMKKMKEDVKPERPDQDLDQDQDQDQDLDRDQDQDQDLDRDQDQDQDLDQDQDRLSYIKGLGKRRRDLVGPEAKRSRSQSPSVPTDAKLPPFQPNNPLGQEFVVPKSGFFCNLCSVFYLNESSARRQHCSSRRHYDNLQKYYQKLQQKPSRSSTQSSQGSISD